MSFDVDKFLSKHHDKCKLDPQLVMILTMKDEYPCDRCNHDRKECDGDEKRVI